MNCIYKNDPRVFLTWRHYILPIYVIKYVDNSNCTENKISFFMSLYLLQQVVILVLVVVK